MAGVQQRHERAPLFAYIGLLLATAIGLTAVLERRAVDAPGSPHLFALVFLAGLLVAAEHLFVRFRFRGEVSSINLVEAVLAPLLFAWSPVVVVAVAASAPLVVAVVRRNEPVKAAFNAAQWALAAAAGAAVISFVRPGAGAPTSAFATVALALAVIGVVNHTAFAGVMAIVRRERPSVVIRELGPTLAAGWLVGSVVNALTGLLFVAAYEGHPASILLFPVPLVVQHIAYRSYAGARTDRLRLAGLHRAAGALSAPFELTDAIRPYLREVADAFEARAVQLILLAGTELEVHALRSGAGTYDCRRTPAGDLSLEAALARLTGPARIDHGHPLAPQLVDAGWKSALVAPLVDAGEPLGALVVLDQEGLEGFEAGELAVIEAFGRETGASLRKGHLVASILEERQKLAEIVNSTSDGMCTLDGSGLVRAWNPACERITGIAATEVVGRPLPTHALHMSGADGEPLTVDLTCEGGGRPSDVRITTPAGREVRLSCSYSVAHEDSERVLVIVARDVTPAEQVAMLREQVVELAAAEEVHRSVVERLQEALTPPPPTVEDVDLGVTFRASDPTSPTGGDLYDWQILPDGDLHLTVVDVLGHGVWATRDALAVISTLRILALQGCELGGLIEQADRVLAAGDREVVATVVIARYSPTTRQLRVASGGHPPAIVVSPSGAVRQLAAPGCAIGWPGAGSLVVVETQLEPGDALVLYTDGLVEARKDILEGLEVLVAEAGAAPPAATALELSDLLMARCLDGAARSDDSLVLAMRAGAMQQDVSWSLTPDPASVSATRRQVAGWCSAHGVAEAPVHEIGLVLTELLTNAVRAARTEVRCAIELNGPWATIEVVDDGPCWEPDLDLVALAPVEAEGGRGLGIVQSLAERLAVRSENGLTNVRATLRAAAAPADPHPAVDRQTADPPTGV